LPSNARFKGALLDAVYGRNADAALAAVGVFSRDCRKADIDPLAVLEEKLG
jgi:hypothetical protein